MKKGTKFKANYETAVFKKNINAYRNETVEAVLIAISEKMAIVEKARMKQAGSKRQEFFVDYYEKKEVGKKKRIGNLSNIEIIEEA